MTEGNPQRGMNAALALADRIPHEFTLQYPRREYARQFRADVRVEPEALSECVLYVHVPFCARRCAHSSWAGERVSPRKRAPNSHTATSANPPQPQPISRMRWPG